MAGTALEPNTRRGTGWISDKGQQRHAGQTLSASRLGVGPNAPQLARHCQAVQATGLFRELRRRIAMRRLHA